MAWHCVGNLAGSGLAPRSVFMPVLSSPDLLLLVEEGHVCPFCWVCRFYFMVWSAVVSYFC